MEWTEKVEDTVTILTISGDIDLNHSPTLRGVFKAKGQEKCPSLLIDFTSVKYIDSSGLATLVEYFQTARGYKGKIALASLTPRVKSVFELVRLSEIFPIFPTIEEAKKSFTL